jgi:hypothetical protein
MYDRKFAESRWKRRGTESWSPADIAALSESTENDLGSGISLSVIMADWSGG